MIQVVAYVVRLGDETDEVFEIERGVLGSPALSALFRAQDLARKNPDTKVTIEVVAVKEGEKWAV